MDEAPRFHSESLIFVQHRQMVAGFNRDCADNDLKQPRLFFWLPDGEMQPGTFFSLLPGHGWREVQYSIDSLVDASEEANTPERKRAKQILNWIFSVWPGLKRQVLAIRQSGSTGVLFSKSAQGTSCKDGDTGSS
jgi:hypothetical protein